MNNNKLVIHIGNSKGSLEYVITFWQCIYFIYKYIYISFKLIVAYFPWMACCYHQPNSPTWSTAIHVSCSQMEEASSAIGWTQFSRNGSNLLHDGVQAIIMQYRFEIFNCQQQTYISLSSVN